MEKVKIGVIGCGNISSVYFKNCIEMFDILEVVACSDIISEKAEEKAKEYNIKACTVEELLKDSSVEIVLNLTIPEVHADISLEALDTGKNVYSEKPLDISRYKAQNIIQKAKEKGLFVGCSPDTFLGGGLQTCRKLLDDGWIGIPTAAIGFMIGGGPERFHPNPEFFYKEGGGPMLDMGPYYLTALISLLGPVKRVTGMAKISCNEKTITGPVRYGEKIKVETPTHITGIMEFDNGITANIVTSFDLHYPYWESKLPYIQIFGSEGTLSVPDPNKFEGPVMVRRFNGEFTQVPLTHGFIENSRGIGLADMAYAIRTGRRHRANGELALHVLDVILGIYDSSDSGKHYEVQSSCERPDPLPRVLLENTLDV